jgi:hypothetical protein
MRHVYLALTVSEIGLAKVKNSKIEQIMKAHFFGDISESCGMVKMKMGNEQSINLMGNK